jgi:choline monooxygenase
MNAVLREQILSFNADLPLEKAHTIPRRWYFDPDLAELEKRVLFGQTWQVAGRTDSLVEPGAYVTANLASEPILVVRDLDGVLRAFSNVCRHRAAPLLTSPCGKVNKLRCRYHGWTYDLTGRLRGVPEFEGVENFCREEMGLFPLSVDAWGPLVFVHPDPNPPPLHDYLAPLRQRTSASDLNKLRFVERRDYVIACNWKVFVDNYLDGGYHVNSVHPALAGVIDYAKYHSLIYDESSVQLSPLQQPQNPAATAPVRTGGLAQYWWFFPNLMINIYDTVMDTNQVLPLGPDRCHVIFDFYFLPAEGPEGEAAIKRGIEVGHQIQVEDVAICEEVQRGLASRWYESGRFSVRREGPGCHFHQLLARRLKAGL